MQKPFSVCISGHRPEKLPKGVPLRMIQSLLYSEISKAVAEGAETFYCGMARGVDLWAADIILHLRKQYPQVKLICVLPFRDRIRHLRGDVRYHVMTVLNAADEVVALSEQYYRGCYRDRNAYMVQHSQWLIAVIGDRQSGTGQTVRMAERAGLSLHLISTEDIMQQNEPAHEYFSF